ncbi:MAG TPA: hypothetical protein VH638_06110, partial [Gemmatimonadaceae bacterium]
MLRTLVATLLSATFAFQMLAADTVACTGSAETAAMPGMNMANEGSAPDHTGHQLPCDEPVTAPSCLLMAPCTASFVGAVATRRERALARQSAGAATAVPVYGDRRRFASRFKWERGCRECGESGGSA